MYNIIISYIGVTTLYIYMIFNFDEIIKYIYVKRRYID